jgi:hypothetical protein
MFARTQAAPRVFRMVGLGSLALANVAQMLLRHYHRPAGDFGDGVLGALYGVAIGALIVWLMVLGNRSRHRH